MLNELAAASLTSDIQPRVFDENFPNRIIYIGDIIPGRAHALAQRLHRRCHAARGSEEDRS